MGTLGHQLLGTMEYHDEANQLKGFYTFNKSRWSTQDQFVGEI